MDEFKQKRLRYLQLKKKKAMGLSMPQQAQETTSEGQNPMIDMASRAVSLTPIGMVSSGANAVTEGIGKAMDVTGIPVSESVQKGAKAVFRPFRSLGVGAVNAMPILPKTPAETSESMARAFQPDYQPQGMREKIGSSIGENAPVVAASILSPTIGGPAAMMAQQAQSGRVSPLPLAIPAGQGANKLLSKKLLPPLLKSTKGIPPEVTRMATEDPKVLDLPGTSQSIQGKAQNIISGIKEAQDITAKRFGGDYLEQGMRSPVDEVIAGNKSNYGSKSFEQLRSDFHSAKSGDLFRKSDALGVGSEMSNQDKLLHLTQLKRALQDKAIYPAPGQQLAPSQGVDNAAIKNMAAEIDQIRGTFPGGDKLALADDAWSEMQEIKGRLMSSFRDPYTGQDYLNRILKGNTDWLTSGRNAGRVGAIQRVEQITGKELLKPALKEMASAYLNNPDVLSLPGFGLQSIISALVPGKTLIRGATQTIPSILKGAAPTITGRKLFSNPSDTTNNPKNNKANNGYGNRSQNNNADDLENGVQHKPLFTSSPSVNQQNSNLSILKPKKHLDKELARKFLDIANGDKDLAREIARKAGYEW